jgi:predicted unusual protein kinase regulating ubiquinone biosynthesis (AarF/ABC1/UbiB family)
MDKETRIPKSKLARGAVVGGTAVRVGAKRAVHYGKRPFLSEKKRTIADQEIDAEIAHIIFNALSVLRGTALKAAQLVAMEIEMLPEAYRNELAKASSQVPPMNRALVRRIVKTELGPLGEVFRHFDLLPFAAASLGQVHGAMTLKNESVAVKVQYPGMAEGVSADVALLKRVLSPTMYARVFSNCFKEIQNKVHEELDYRKEAMYTELFLRCISDDRFILPRVYKSLSTRTVLTTSRLSGLHLSEWLATAPSREARDRFGQLIVDFFHLTAFGHGVIHADPNPGNFLFRSDGRLGIVDFGCVVALDQQFVAAMARLLGTTTHIRTAVEEALHNAAGIHYRYDMDREGFDAFFKEWVQWLKEPYSKDGYDFAENADYFERGHRLQPAFQKYIDYYDGSFIYFGRTLHGMMRILQQLGARVKMAPPIESTPQGSNHFL